jgi:head-tail adaptor
MAFDPCQINAGDLRHSITINQQVGTRDAAGQPNSSWTALLTTRAAITSTNSQTFKFSFQGNALASASTDLLTIRYPGSSVVLIPGMQIVYGTELYTLNAIDNVQRRNRVLNLACTSIGTTSA